MPRGVGLYGPGVPGRLRRHLPSGRKQMRFVLTVHLQQMRALNAPPQVIAQLERELARYGGDPSSPGDTETSAGGEPG
jgi:hypothetical protein